jgi:Divergent InlB B-repeat domain
LILGRVRGRRLAGVVVLLAALFAGGYTMSALGRGSDDSPTIVVDQSIGGISIDMSQADVEALYGPPDEFTTITLPNGVGVLAHYHLHGGDLIVVYAEGHVVSIETTSPFYKTAGGAGPGGPISSVKGFQEDFCSGGLWDGASATSPGDVVTVFERNGDEIGAVTITKLGFYDLCDSTGADQEVPQPPESSYPLTVTIDPDGGGWVRSSPYNIDCPSACTRSFETGAIVSFEAHPTGGFTFVGWGGACTGTGDCIVRVDGPTTVTAYFSGHYVPTTTTRKIKTTTTNMDST